MKKLTCTLAALALVVATSIPARAEFRGTLQRNLPWMLEIVSGSTDTISATISYVGRDVEVVEVVTVPLAASIQQNVPRPGRGVKRVVVEVDLPLNGQALYRVTQGGTLFADTISCSRVGESHRFVFDVD